MGEYIYIGKYNQENPTQESPGETETPIEEPLQHTTTKKLRTQNTAPTKITHTQNKDCSFLYKIPSRLSTYIFVFGWISFSWVPLKFVYFCIPPPKKKNGTLTPLEIWTQYCEQTLNQNRHLKDARKRSDGLVKSLQWNDVDKKSHVRVRSRLGRLRTMGIQRPKRTACFFFGGGGWILKAQPHEWQWKKLHKFYFLLFWRISLRFVRERCPENSGLHLPILRIGTLEAYSREGFGFFWVWVFIEFSIGFKANVNENTPNTYDTPSFFWK